MAGAVHPVQSQPVGAAPVCEFCQPQQGFPLPRFVLQNLLEELSGFGVPASLQELPCLEHRPVRLRDAGKGLRVGAEGPVQEAFRRVRVVSQAQAGKLHPEGGAGGDIDGGLEGLQDVQRHRPLHHQSGAGPDLQRILDLSEGIHPEVQPVRPTPFHCGVEGALPGGIGKTSGPLQGKPPFRPAAGGQGIEAGLGDGIHRCARGVLNEETAGLELYVLAVGVGKKLLPDASLPG